MSGFNQTSSGGPAYLAIAGSVTGTALQDLLLADDIQPGSAPSYQTCKTIYLYHPLGAKMAGAPIAIAQSQEREIAVPGSPEERVREAFSRVWKLLQCDRYIFTVHELSRVYGVATVLLGVDGKSPTTPLSDDLIRDAAEAETLFFNVLDPLNTSGSMTINQDPNSRDFQRPVTVTVSGVEYHPSRAVIVQNENPIYIDYNSSGFGYTGRSVYQRALYPMKSFVQSMKTDDMVTRKAGLLIAKLKQAGSIADRIMALAAGFKRQLLKEAQTDQVLSIGIDEDIESLNLQNIDSAAVAARKNILENIAAADNMPAIMLNSETFAQGLAEGSEDAKTVARFVDRMRLEMNPTYAFFDRVVQLMAWTPNFYRALQAEFSELADIPFNVAFQGWKSAFTASWPSLLTEPDSEKIKVEETKFKAITGILEIFLPVIDPQNKGVLAQWAEDNINENKMLFPSPLEFDIDAFVNYVPPAPPGGEGESPSGPGQEEEPKPPPPMEGKE